MQLRIIIVIYVLNDRFGRVGMLLKLLYYDDKSDDKVQALDEAFLFLYSLGVSSP